MVEPASEINLSLDIEVRLNLLFHTSRLIHVDFQEAVIIHEYNSCMSRNLIETKSFQKLSMAVLDYENGVVIVGPKGVGKTSSLFYLLHKLRGKKKDSIILWLSSEMLGWINEDWNAYAKSCLKEGKELPCFKSWSIINLSLLFPSFHVQLERELINTMDWNQKVEKVLFKILLRVTSKEFYLLMDEGSSMTYEKVKTFYDIAAIGIRNGKKVILATSSGRRWLAHKNLHILAASVHSRLKQLTILPFTLEEAKQFLTSSGVNMKFFNDIVKVAGTSPLMLQLL